MAGSKKKDKKPKVPEKVGRPTKYDPKYCEMLIEHMKQGFSFESFAGLIEVSRAVLYDWEKAHSEFLDAKKLGAEQNLLYWERQGQEGLWEQTEYNEKGRPVAKKTLNSTVWIFNMKNRHRWKDRHEVEAKTTISENSETKVIITLPDNGRIPSETPNTANSKTE